MKAITLTQPWASLVALGAKKVETRSWLTRYRGPVAIHAAKAVPAPVRLLLDEPAFVDPFVRAGLVPAGADLSASLGDSDVLPLGAFVAVARVVACERIDEYYGPRLHCSDPQEFGFGDYAPGRWAWRLDGVKPLPAPIPYAGQLGLWDVPEDLALAFLARPAGLAYDGSEIPRADAGRKAAPYV